MIFSTPPLIITEEQLQEGLDALDKALEPARPVLRRVESSIEAQDNAIPVVCPTFTDEHFNL